MARVCRLCASNNTAINLVEPGLKYAEMIRCCILLATGIEIKTDDLVSTMICHRCSEIVLKLHKYRMNAISNDKLLKQMCGQNYLPPIMDSGKLENAVLTLEKLRDENVEVAQLDLLSAPISKCVRGLINSDLKHSDNLKTSAVNQRNNNLEVIECSKSEATKATIHQHSSVKKLLSEYKNIILPMEVSDVNISPIVILETNCAHSAKQIHSARDELREDSPISFTISGNSSDSEVDSEPSPHNISLRKRSKRRVIIDSDSEDDRHVRKKLPKRTKIISPTKNISGNINSLTSKSMTLQISAENNNFPLMQKSASTPRLVTTKTVQTNLKRLLTEFNKYGINIENSEQPIVICDDKDPTDIDEDVICTYDGLFMNTNNTDLEVKSLFEKHYHFSYKPKTIFAHTKKREIVLQNMLTEVNRYDVPLDIDYSDTFHIQFLKNNSDSASDTNSIKFWNYQDCTDINKPVGPLYEIPINQSVNKTSSVLKTASPTSTVCASATPNNLIIILRSTLAQSINQIPSTTTSTTAVSQISTAKTVVTSSAKTNVVSSTQKSNRHINSISNKNSKRQIPTKKAQVPIVTPTRSIGNIQKNVSKSIANATSKTFQIIQRSKPPQTAKLQNVPRLNQNQPSQQQSSQLDVGRIRVKNLSELIKN